MSWASPCRRRATGRRHHCSWWHAQLVSSYQEARHAQLARAEAWASGYATELDAYWREVEAPLTFGQWLLWARGTGAPAV